MDLDELQHRGRGRETDYVFGTASHGWQGFDVVRFHAVEELSRPFHYDVVVVRDPQKGRAALDPLLDEPATLRIATEGRWRPVHGIIAEAEEIDVTSSLLVYRFLLVPHLYRARFRRRCRNFVGQTLSQIVSSVLQNRAPAFTAGAAGLESMTGPLEPPEATPSFQSFRPPRGVFRWDVGDVGRVHKAVTRPYVAQYNESDLDFVSRLLEEEGITYHFEHARDACVLTLTDRPGKAPLFERDEVYRIEPGHGGNARDQEVIRTFREARRMRSRSVTARDWSWRRSRTVLEARVSTADGAADASGHFEFPAGDEDVEKDPCMAPARRRMQRFEVERNLTSCSSSVRTAEPGHVFKLVDASLAREEASFLVVRVETYAAQRAPRGTSLEREPFGFRPGAEEHLGYENEMVVLPVEIPFRPALETPRPRIDGVQTALVTAEEIEGPPEINCDKQGRVRVRFPWDQREPDNKTPSSDWIRVSQAWAGGAYGAVHVPRVGHEVLVAYLQGDPDRPVIVGRVYNEQTPPPYDLAKDPTVSTVKSRSSPDSEGFNEFRFEDRARHEQIYLHAQRNLDEVVRADHTTSVGHDQKNVVNHDQWCQVDNDRIHIVGNIESLTIWGDREGYFKSNELRWIDGVRTTRIGKDENVTILASRSTEIAADGGSDRLVVHGDRNATIEADDGRFVTGADYLDVGAESYRLVGGSQYWMIGVDWMTTVSNHLMFDSNTLSFHQKDMIDLHSKRALFIQQESFEARAPKLDLKAGGARIQMSDGVLVLDNGAGSTISLIGDKVIVQTGGLIQQVKNDVIELSGSHSKVCSQKIHLAALAGTLSGSAPKIAWNG